MSKQGGAVDKDGYTWPRWYLDWLKEQARKATKAELPEQAELSFEEPA